MKKEMNLIVSEMKRVAKLYQVEPFALTQAQFLKETDVKEWQLRKLGGFAGIKKVSFPQQDKELAEIQSGKTTLSYIRKLEKQLAERQLFEECLTKDVMGAINRLPTVKIDIPKLAKSNGKREMTIEFMLSDIHYGKLTGGDKPFNLSICRARVRHAVTVLLREIEQSQSLFNVERLIIAVIGDLIESYTMHLLESAIGCEFHNPSQIDEAVESIWFDVVVPLAKTGLAIDFVGVTGNHDRSETKRTMNKPGLNQLSYIVYKAIERLAKVSGVKNVKFHIPHEPFYVLDIYGSPCLYEHGDNVGAPEKRQFELLMQKRGKQVGKQIHFLRCGHFHFYACFDRGRIIVNESVCGSDGYSETMGFDSTAGQTINYYIKTDVRPTPFFRSFPVCLDHITG
jgi:predicted phosphodiesterase